MSWTINSISKLKKLWNKELSTTDIGKKLGFSKNAVVGKAHRLGLKSRSTSVVKKIKRKRVIKTKAKAPIKSIIKTKKTSSDKQKINKKTTPSKIIGIMDLKKEMCRWPLGDPRSSDFSFCGNPTFKSKPYCLTHCTEAYALSAKPKEKPKSDDKNNKDSSK